jgi:nucleotide-binding universal stress UspA family protein
MQAPFKKIILATDFSDTAKDASLYALWLTKTLGAELIPLHVFDISVWNVPSQYYLKPGFDGVVEGIEDSKKRGKDTLRKLEEEFDIKVDTVFTEGRAGEEIVRIATELNADIIVLGTHGYSGWKRFTIGSVAEYIVRHAPCAVLTTKHIERRKEERRKSDRRKSDSQ